MHSLGWHRYYSLITNFWLSEVIKRSGGDKSKFTVDVLSALSLSHSGLELLKRNLVLIQCNYSTTRLAFS